MAGTQDRKAALDKKLQDLQQMTDTSEGVAAERGNVTDRARSVEGVIERKFAFSRDAIGAKGILQRGDAEELALDRTVKFSAVNETTRPC